VFTRTTLSHSPRVEVVRADHSWWVSKLECAERIGVDDLLISRSCNPQKRKQSAQDRSERKHQPGRLPDNCLAEKEAVDFFHAVTATINVTRLKEHCHSQNKQRVPRPKAKAAKWMALAIECLGSFLVINENA
jgi:hypothetical protein